MPSSTSTDQLNRASSSTFTDHLAQNREAEYNLSRELAESALQNRPKNTKKAFIHKQEEFIDWARENHYYPPEIVYEEKLVRFLKARVIGRLSRNHRYDEEPTVIQKGTVLQYVTAITSLWKYQCLLKINSNPNPRGNLVKSVLEDLSLKTSEDRRKSYFDRGRLYQHLLSNEMKKNRKLVSDYFWNYGSRNRTLAFRSLRNRLGFLLSENGLLRGENVRDLQLPDFFCVEMDDEGPTDCNAMVIVKDRGKTNQYGKALFSGFYRHSDVSLCAVSTTGFYLFLR
jgi:hypothetical protein